MNLNTTMFANHVLDSDTQIENANNFTFHPQKQVLDIGGSAALPFLRHILDSDVVKLTAPGMGIQSTLRPKNTDFEVQVISINGYAIYRQKYAAFTGDNALSLSMSNIPPGIYLAQIKTGNEIKSLKFVKN